MSYPLNGKKVLLGVTGGIAAYKAVFLLRLLRKQGADVQVVMTEAACEFVSPLTFETLSERKVHVHMFSGSRGAHGTSPVEHIELSKWPDVIVVAPVTANTISKLAHGRADNLLSAVISAFAGVVFLAPAMNEKMWENEIVRENLAYLGNKGFRVVPPGKGELACGDEGEGRMAEPEIIMEALGNFFSGDYGGLKVLISAGRTEENLDPVRFISNRSSGKMGFALAEAARDWGAEVTVVSGSVSIAPPEGVKVVRATTAEQMSRELEDAFKDADVLIMAAAVSDYTVSKPLKRKQKDKTWVVELERTEDILASLGAQKGGRFVIGFALETENLEANEAEKLTKKNCDLIVANDPTEEGAGFGHDTNSVKIFNRKGLVLSTGLKSKREIAEIILRTALQEEAFKKIRR